MKGICRERVLSDSTLDALLVLIRLQEMNCEVVKRFIRFLLDVADYGLIERERVKSRDWTGVIVEY